MDRDDGFEDFYRATRHRVVTVLYALSGDIHEAQDAAQEAYVRAWQRWQRIGEYGDPEAWVHGVGHRLLLNRWRKIRNGIRANRRTRSGQCCGTTLGEHRRAGRGVTSVADWNNARRSSCTTWRISRSRTSRLGSAVPVGTVKARLARGP